MSTKRQPVTDESDIACKLSKFDGATSLTALSKECINDKTASDIAGAWKTKISIECAMIDNIGGPRRVNNFLTTLNVPPISNKNLKFMEVRAGNSVELVADQSAQNAASSAFQQEIIFIIGAHGVTAIMRSNSMASISPGEYTKKYAIKRMKERTNEMNKSSLPSTKRRRLILKQERATTQATLEVGEGASYQSGVALESSADIEKIPDAVPRANFQSLSIPHDSVTVVSMDLETTDLKEGISLYHSPFPHCIVPNIIKKEGDLETILLELQDLEFAEKNNDLYQFHQTVEDLKSATSPHIKGFRDQLCTTFRDWLIKATGIPLNDTVDMFCARYGHTDTLLCHDDELEGRRIAYIFYLVNTWAETDGGSLDLFSVDENYQPVKIVKSILPTRNSLVFFEVSPGSYHQVAEVLTQDKNRWSIGGWFHGPPIQRPSPYLEAPRQLSPYGTIDDDVFFDWINPVYMGIGAQGSIQEKFEMDSEIELQDFFLPEKYEELLTALKAENMCWARRGPPNKRCYDQAVPDKVSAALQTCIDLFKSDAMFLMLSNFTGLKLHELAGESSDSEKDESDSESGTGTSGVDGAGSSNDGESSKHAETGSDNKEDKKDKVCPSRCRSEFRRWRERCYTLVHDTDTEGSEFALDAVFYVGCEDWESECGGFTSYIAKGEDEELLTVTPKANALALVYRDKETLKFVKYLNNKVNKMKNRGFYDISTVFYEKI